MFSVIFVDQSIVQPTYFGYIETPQDMRLLLAACLLGKLGHVYRFPPKRELEHIVCSGHIFVYADNITPGEWKDGINWAFLSRNGELLEEIGPRGLMKRSGSIMVRGVRHGFVSYFKLLDIVNLERPSQDVRFQEIQFEE